MLSQLSTKTQRTESHWATWLDSYEGLPPPAAVQTHTRSSKLYRRLDDFAELPAGLFLAGLLALGAHYVADWIGEGLLGFEKSPIGSIPLAIALGATLRNTIGIPRPYEAGLRGCLRFVLRVGISLLGLRLSLPAVAAIGVAGLPVILCCISTALLVVGPLSRALRISVKQGYLIAVGTGVCGVSAIAATASVIDAEEDEVSYSIACVTLFGMLAMLCYPLFAFMIFDGNRHLAGYLLGTSIHDTAQVTGAAMMYRQQFQAPEALDVATVTKLIRNTSMIVIIPLVAFLVSRSEAQETRKAAVRLKQVAPAFVLAYLGLAAVRSIGDLGDRPFGLLDPATWQAVIGLADGVSSGLLAIAMAAVGLGTDLNRIRKLGWRPMVVGLTAALVVGAASLTVLKLFPPSL